MASSASKVWERYRKLVESSNWWDRQKAASSTKCPPELLRILTEREDINNDPYSSLGSTLMKNPSLPEDILVAQAERYISYRKHSRTSFESMRYAAVLTNTSLPSQTCLKVYVEGRYPNILSHPNFPQTYIYSNMNSFTGYEKEIIATNKSLTKGNQDKLLTNGSKVMLRLLARNKSVHPTIARKLAKVESAPTLRALLRNRAVSEKTKEIAVNTLLAMEAPRGVHTTAVLAQHAKDENLYREIVENADLEHPVVASSILANPLADSSVVEQVCYSPNPAVREKAVNHSECTDMGRVIAALNTVK